MLRSDEILYNASGRGLSKTERQELVEAYRWEQQQEDRQRYKLEQSVKGFKDDKNKLNMPRHRALEHNIPFEECPICFKNRNLNTRHMRVSNFMDRYPEDFCMKPEIHNHKTFEMMIVRERIDLDKDERNQNQIRI